jgi:hypothetical protein
VPNAITMNTISRPSSSTPLKATVNEYQSSRPFSSCPAAAARALLAVGLVLVVQRFEAARPQDRLAQPLQPEREQQRADDEAQRVDRDPLQRRPEHRDERQEHDRGSRDPAASLRVIRSESATSSTRRSGSEPHTACMIPLSDGIPARRFPISACSPPRRTAEAPPSSPMSAASGSAGS